MGCSLHLSPKFYNNVFLFVGFDVLILDWLVHYVRCQTKSHEFWSTMWGKFVYHQWWFELIYRPLSYPFRSVMVTKSSLRTVISLSNYIRLGSLKLNTKTISWTRPYILETLKTVPSSASVKLDRFLF